MRDAIQSFYTVKSLNEADRNISFRNLIQSFLAVCNAVAFAHEQKVIHRDIKPDNIMLGEFGEVILLDWGLAKRTDEPEPLPTLAADPVADSTYVPTKTQSGTKLGSPAYMAPEQAAGRVEDHGPHTDVYGLGATLYEILTGDVPFTGTTTDELLTAIQTRDPKGIREINRKVPSSLAAICHKAMAKSPANRYVSAHALADDIQHWLADEPVSVLPESWLVRAQRLSRKHPGASAALAATILVGLVGASLGLVLVSSEKENTRKALVAKSEALDEARTQRQKAIDNAEEAKRFYDEKRTSLDDMLTVFSDNRLKQQSGTQPVRKQFLEVGFKKYQDALKDRASDPDVLKQTISTLSELGEVQDDLGEATESLQTIKQAVSICRTALEANPGDAQLRLLLGNALYDLGQEYFDRKQFTEIAPLADEAETIFRELLLASPNAPELLAGLGRALIHKAYRRQPGDGGTKDDSDAIDLLKKALEKDTDNPEYLSDLGRAINNQMVFKLGNADSPELNDAIAQAIALQERAIALRPNLRVAHSRRVLFLKNLQLGMVQRGEFSQSYDRLSTAIADSRQFSEDNPEVPDGIVGLSELLTARAQTLQYQNLISEAVADYEQSASLLAELTRRFPENQFYALLRIKSLAAIVPLTPEASKQGVLNRIIELSDATLRRIPSWTLAGEFLNAINIQGSLLNNAAKVENARDLFWSGVTIFRDLRMRNPEHPEAAVGYYLTCAAEWAETMLKLDQHDELARSIDDLQLVPLDSLQDSNNQEAFLRLKVQNSRVLEKLGRIQESLALLVYVRDTGRKLLGGDRTANWYIYQQVFGSYQHIARLARIAKNESVEFEALRAYFSETQPYVSNQHFDELLKATEVQSPSSLLQLRSEFDKTYDKGSLKRFTVPVEFAGVKFPFSMYVSDGWDFFKDQITFVERVRGGKFPVEAKDSFRRLYDIAQENKVSFPDLCVYALAGSIDPQRAGTAEIFQNQSPIGIAKKFTGLLTDDSFAELRGLAQSRANLRRSNREPAVYIDLLNKILMLTEEKLGTSNYFIAKFLLIDADELLTDAMNTSSDQQFHSLKQQLLYLQGSFEAATGNPEGGYRKLLDTLVSGAGSASELTRSGAREFALGWTADKLNRPIESVSWYIASARANHIFAHQAVFLVWSKHPEVERCLPAEWAEKLAIAKSKESKDVPAALLFQELVKSTALVGKSLSGTQSETEKSNKTASQEAGVAVGPWEKLMEADRNQLGDLLSKRIAIFAKKGDAREVARSAMKLRELGGPDNLFHAACGFSRCVNLISDDTTISSANAALQTKKGVELAIQCLKEAISLGFTDLEELHTDEALEAIRQNPEFQALFPDSNAENGLQPR